jgi:hypothetical protein
MLTVLIKTWRPLEDAAGDIKPATGDDEEQIFECKSASFFPAGRLHKDTPVLQCEGPGDWTSSYFLTSWMKAYVMNSAGKTVATYRGADDDYPPIGLRDDACADPALVARSYELRQSDLEAAIAAQIPPR